MAQQLSPWLEGAYGWNFGEGGWNTGMDQNLLKFSFLFDRNVDSITASLPSAVNGQAHYLTTDNRIYFAVGTTYFSSPVPKWFVVVVRSTGQTHQFNGTALVQIDTPAQLDSRLDAVEVTVSTLGTAAFQSVEFFATQSELDVAVAPLQQFDADIQSTTDATKGSSLVGWKQNSAGSVGRPASQKLSENLSVKDFGAVGNDISDDRSSINSAVQQYSGTGGALFFPKGTYKVSGQDGAGVLLNKPVNVRGENAIYTAINPSLAASTDNTITINPSPSFAQDLLKISDISLHDPSTGLRTGSSGIFATTQDVGQQLPKLTLRDMIIGQGSNPAGWGFYHLNDGVDNVNGGMYAALFQNTEIKGGIRLEVSGDSNSILHNIISGSRTGVWATLVAGASLLEIQSNNITTADGAIHIDAGSRYRILGNNIENIAAGAGANNNAAIIDINGANGTMYGGVIKENLVSGFGSTTATRLIRLRNSHGVLIEDNVLLSGVGGLTVGIDIGADCHNTRVGANTYNSGITTKVLDNGVGTMGVVKTPTLQNGWVAFVAGNSTLQFIKSSDGIVHVFGSIKDGTITAGTIITNLPVGFRPSETVRSPIMVNNAGTAQIAEVRVDSAGDMRIDFVLANTQLNINFSFPASDLANAVSSE